MTIVLGALLAGGVLLVAAPWLWPAGREAAAAEQPTGALVRLLEAAGFASVRPRVVLILAAALAVVAAAIVWLVTGVPVLCLVAAGAAAVAPIAWLRARRTRLLRTRRGLWPDVCDLLIASVRAGMSLPDAVTSLAVSAPPPLRPALAAFGRDMAASGHFDSSAMRLKTALSDPVADRIIETLRMARQVGGTELTTVLRALANSVRADATLRGEVEAKQSWVRGAAVLGVVAPWVILVLLALRQEGAQAYASAEGVGLILAGAVVSVVAFRIMLRIGRLPEPRRWFG
jgi:tight adherence protein B